MMPARAVARTVIVLTRAAHSERVGLVRFAIAALLAALLLAVAGCGESKEDKAKKQVCSARADLQKQVNELSSLTLATATVNGVKDSVNAITNDLKKIKDAQRDLNAAR